MLKEKMLAILDRKTPAWLYYVFAIFVLSFYSLAFYWRWEDREVQKQQAADLVQCKKDYQSLIQDHQIFFESEMIKEKFGKEQCIFENNPQWTCQNKHLKCSYNGQVTECFVLIECQEKKN